MSSAMRTTLQTVPESLATDHVTNSKGNEEELQLQQKQTGQQQQQQEQQPQDRENGAADNKVETTATPAEDDGGPKRPPPNLDHGILTTKDGTPLIRLRSKKSIMESRFKLTMRTWDDVWKSTAWAKFAPEKLKHTLQRSARNHGELKAGDGETAAVLATAVPPATIPVKKSRFRVVPHVQIEDRPARPPADSSQSRSSPNPPLSVSSGSSDTDSERLPAGLPMIESNLNELTMVESELKKLEREHVAKHQLLTPKSDGVSAEKTSSSTADDSGGGGSGAAGRSQQRGVDGKKEKSPKVSSRAEETHSKRLGWLKAFRRKSSADTGSETAAAAAKSTKHHKQQHAAARSSSSAAATGGKHSSSSPRQQLKHRASARPRQQHHVRVQPGTAVPVSIKTNDFSNLFKFLWSFAIRHRGLAKNIFRFNFGES